MAVALSLLFLLVLFLGCPLCPAPFCVGCFPPGLLFLIAALFFFVCCLFFCKFLVLCSSGCCCLCVVLPFCAAGHCIGILVLVCLRPPPFLPCRFYSCLVVFLVLLSSVVVFVCALRLLVSCPVCLLCCVLMSWGGVLAGGYVVCAWSMSSLSAALLHRREVLPHMCIMLFSLFFFVLLLLVGRSGGFRARAHHA